MPRTYSSIEKIRAELAWSMNRSIRTSAVAGIFCAANRLHTLPGNALASLPTKCGPIDGSISVQNAGRMSSAGIASDVT
jgi:hypothetical protein